MQDRRLALLGWLVLAACGTEVPLPPDAKISCSTAGDCPGDLVCHRGRCLSAEGLDTTPPDLAAAPEVSPAVGRAGADFEIVLEPTEPLDAPPEVTLRLLIPAVAPCAADGALWRCAYTATGDENGGLGGVVPFDVRLVDRGQNETQRRLAGTLHLDFAPPALAAASVSPADAPLDGVLQVFFTTNEPLASDPVLVASRALDHGSPATRFPVPAQPGTLNHLFTHLVTAGDASGPVDFTVEVTDVAGNAATLPVGSVALDNVPPLIAALSVDPARIDETGTVTVTFDVSEPAAWLEVTVGGRPLTCSAYSGTAPSYTCTREMTGLELPADTEAAQAVLVALSDAAGNPAQASGSVVFDFRPPAVATVAISYLPEATNPLQAVARARPGTTVLVGLTADEALDLAIPPSLSMTGVPAFAIVAGSSGPTGAVFEAVAPALSDGDYPLQVVWTDLAGNSASLAIPAPAVRLKSSVPVLAVDQAAVTFVRAPWGVADVGATVTAPAVAEGRPFAALAPADPLSPVERLPASTFIAPGGVAVLRIWKDFQRTGLLVSRVLPEADGTWPRALVPGGEDLPKIFLTAVDDAGNESAAVRLLNAEWIATGGRPVAGASPHAIHSLYYASAGLVPPPAVSEPVEAGSPRLGLVQQAHATLRQRFAATAAAPSARTDFLLVFDPARGRAVLHGGLGPGGQALSDTWEWDGTSWAEVTPASGYGPHPASSRGAAAYDGARGRLVVLDGSFQIWEWDGASWIQRYTFGNCADPRGLAAYDPVRERTVVAPFHDTPYAFTCEWDGSSLSSTPFGADPPRLRHDAAMAYDARRGVMVRLGGLDYSVYPPVAKDELWERAGTTWSEVAQGGAAPGARHGHALAYDSTSGRILLFGGQDATGTLHADVRAWSGASWSVVTPPGPGPAPRRKAGATFDTIRGRLLVHGGLGAGDTVLTDTWELGPDGWLEVTVGRASPAPRRGAAMAYDPLREVLVLAGGRDLWGSFADVWEYDGLAWRDCTPTPGLPSPGGRTGHAMAFHSASERLLLFGGFDAQTSAPVADLWEWTGSAWVELTPAPSPPARTAARMTDDAVRGALVLLGGYFENPTRHPTDHWELSAPAGALTWTQRATDLPAGLPRAEHAQFFDGVRTLVVGGNTVPGGVRSDVWSFENGSWTQLVPDTPGYTGPPDARGPGAYDARRRRGFVPGDPAVSYDPYRLEWDGTGFDVIRPTSTERWALDDRQEPAIAFDARRGRVVIFGGGDGSGSRVVGDTWELDADTLDGPGGPVQRRAPAVQLKVRQDEAGFTFDRVQSLRVRARAGGDAGSAGIGARLLGWHRGGQDNPGGRWVALAENGDGVPLGASPAGLIDWTVPAGELARYFRERDSELAFQVRPAGAPPPAAAEATVQAEYLEVRVRYTTVVGPSP